MIGSVIARIRRDKHLSKTDLANKTNINIGHLTHIEKEERNPSHKTLKVLCNALEIPLQPIMHTYDKDLTEDQLRYSAYNHVKYDSIPVFGSLEGFSKCPKELFNVSFATRYFDSSMAPKINVGDIVFVEFNAPLSNKDIGLFEYNGSLMIRKFIIRQKDLVLRAEDDSIEDIVVTKDFDFSIIGKVLGASNSSMSDFVFF